MTLVTFAKIPNNIDASLLRARIKKVFSGEENGKYIDEICSRRNQDSIIESLSALLLLSSLLEKCGKSNCSPILARGENGKPYFLNSSLLFSISHSHGYVAAAISNLCDIGIDIEASDASTDRAQRLANRFFCKDELVEIQTTPESFLKIWTRKEARAKMRGISLSELITNEKNIIDNRTNQEFYTFFEADGHPLTLCSKKYDDTTCFFESNIEDML